MAKKVPLSQRRRCLIRPAKPVTGSASATASLMYSRLQGGERGHGKGSNQRASQPGEGGKCQERDSSVVQPASQPCHVVRPSPTHLPTPAAQSPHSLHSLVLAVLARHNLQAQHTILSQVHVGLKRAQVVLGVETVEVAAQRLALRGRRVGEYRSRGKRKVQSRPSMRYPCRLACARRHQQDPLIQSASPPLPPSGRRRRHRAAL